MLKILRSNYLLTICQPQLFIFYICNFIVVRMSKDGREMAWRNLCEGDVGEAAPLPDKMDEVLTSLQRLCIIRACRADRIMQASSLFIQAVLGKK